LSGGVREGCVAGVEPLVDKALQPLGEGTFRGLVGLRIESALLVLGKANPPFRERRDELLLNEPATKKLTVKLLGQLNIDGAADYFFVLLVCHKHSVAHGLRSG